MFAQEYKLDVVILCQFQLLPETFVTLAYIAAQLTQVLFPVDDQPGIIVVHVIPYHQF